MGKKARVLGFFIKLALFIAFVFCEYKMYSEYKRSKSVLDFKKSAVNKEIKDSFLLREEDFYLDKVYLKKYEELKKNPPESIKTEESQGGVVFE